MLSDRHGVTPDKRQRRSGAYSPVGLPKRLIGSLLRVPMAAQETSGSRISLRSSGMTTGRWCKGRHDASVARQPILRDGPSGPPQDEDTGFGDALHSPAIVIPAKRQREPGPGSHCLRVCRAPATGVAAHRSRISLRSSGMTAGRWCKGRDDACVARQPILRDGPSGPPQDEVTGFGDALNSPAIVIPAKRQREPGPGSPVPAGLPGTSNRRSGSPIPDLTAFVRDDGG